MKDKSSKFITGTHGSLSVVTVNANVIERKKKKKRAKQTMWIPEEVAEEMVRSPVQEIPVPGIKKNEDCVGNHAVREIYMEAGWPHGGWVTYLSKKK